MAELDLLNHVSPDQNLKYEKRVHSLVFSNCCNYLYENNTRCEKTYQLHGLYFHDPYSPSYSFYMSLCKWHADEITDLLMYRAREYQMKLANMISEEARLRRIAREYGTYRKNEMITQKIADMKSLIKRLQNHECKNIFCRKDLTRLDENAKLYSVIIFKPSGRRWYTFYYCSLKCYTNMKAKCGIIQDTARQNTLDKMLI